MTKTCHLLDLYVLHQIFIFKRISVLLDQDYANSIKTAVLASMNLTICRLSHSPTTGGWTCAELYPQVKFGFGTFRWFVEGAIDQFDPNVVSGLFTYGGVDGTNEIDIEVAKWGRTDPVASNLFYTTYPSALNAAEPVSVGTHFSLEGTYTTRQFIWSHNKVASQIQGDFISLSQTQNLIFFYKTPTSFSSALPSTKALLHMNLWAFQGKPPINGQEVEIIIHDFKYIKA